MKNLVSLLEDPPLEDSEGFSEEEALAAEPTANADDLIHQILKQIRGSRVAKFVVKSHEMRRWGGHMYCRIRLGAVDEPDKVLIYQIDWVLP